VHHAHRPLAELQPALALTMDEAALAHSVLNDALLTDLPLLHAPHALALAGAFLAVVLKHADGPGGGGGAGAGGRGGGQGQQRGQQQQAVGVGAPAASAAQLTAAMSGASASGAPTASPRVQKLLAWVAESPVPVEALVECAQELISLYEVWDGYRESTCREAIVRFVSARGMEK
jgi:cyclin C